MTATVLLGPPGSGKGTVAETLMEKGCTHVSTGDLLREQIRLETPLGREAKILMDNGKFVPDETVIGMVRRLLEAADPGQRFLFDGFPRTLAQAEKFGELILSLGGAIRSVILLECPDETIIERLSGRCTCSRCGTVYHKKYNPPAVPGVCDVDGGELTHRPDDKGKTIRKRLQVYAEQTAPLVAYYKAKNLLHPIDATQTIDEVRTAALERWG